jgi:hypothetical protein
MKIFVAIACVTGMISIVSVMTNPEFAIWLNALGTLVLWVLIALSWTVSRVRERKM